MKNSYQASFADLFKFNLKADWDPYQNSGNTTEGGWVSQQFLVAMTLLFWLIPAPVSIAWFMVLNLIFGGIGTYLCCRLIGASRIASFAGGLLFAIAPENSSLINAGHVLKIATICFAPWVFYCYERAVQGRRLFWFLTTGMVLAFQFFHGHWQIAYYTCLALGVYGVARSFLAAAADRWRGTGKLFVMNIVMVAFFLTSVSISLIPLASWSKDTNRGALSGENRGKGGLNKEEAMSWSMPPEELATFIIPGFFGLSRQEGGENPTNIRSYYWGRMNFTQTSDYMGLLSWILLPLPLIFRRDRYTWLALSAVGVGLLFSMGKYSFFYQFLYEYLPGINRFRVPKMMLFVPLLGLGALTARGIDCLLDGEIRRTAQFRRYLWGLSLLPLLLVVVAAVLHFGRGFWIERFIGQLSQPTRYEQGVALIGQRWQNLMVETWIAALFSALYAGGLWLLRIGSAARLVPFLLIALLVVDIGRINTKFLFLVDPPHKTIDRSTPAMEFLKSQPGNYRTLPLTGDPMPYASKKIPVLFTSSPVQLRRWQELLDSFGFGSPMLDFMNVKYLVVNSAQYEGEFKSFGDRFVPVFSSPEGGELVVENRRVLPKGWLVPSVLHVADWQQALALVNNPSFEPGRIAVVEAPPPLALEPAGAASSPAGRVELRDYAGERVSFVADATKNALLVTGEKHANGWKVFVDGKPATLERVNYVLRGVYLTPGRHEINFVFDPWSFKLGKWLTLGSFALFAVMLGFEWRRWRQRKSCGQ